MAKNSIMIDLDDPRTDRIADVISNKTSKKILSALAEHELTETEISKKLGIPMNTIGYNIDKLEQAGLIDKVSGFYWSQKGKKVYKYKVSNKKIVISPKSILKGIVPSLLVTSAIALGIKIFFGNSQAQSLSMADAPMRASEGGGAVGIATDAAKIAEPSVISQICQNATNLGNAWAWFLLGAFAAIFIFLLWNSTKMKGGN